MVSLCVPEAVLASGMLPAGGKSWGISPESGPGTFSESVPKKFPTQTPGSFPEPERLRLEPEEPSRREGWVKITTKKGARFNLEEFKEQLKARRQPGDRVQEEMDRMEFAVKPTTFKKVVNETMQKMGGVSHSMNRNGLHDLQVEVEIRSREEDSLEHKEVKRARIEFEDNTPAASQPHLAKYLVQKKMDQSFQTEEDGPSVTDANVHRSFWKSTHGKLLPSFVLTGESQRNTEGPMLVASTFDGASDTDHDAGTEPLWRHPALGLLFVTLCILAIAGNCLVVIAVCMKKYLRNPTGYIIVSIAFADLIVDLVVMPLNSSYEMTHHVWLLALTTCDLFHALDILSSTSSIWNMCVIALDRYMAGRDPITYRDKVSTHRITIAICFVWIISASLSFLAIAWWRTSSPHLYQDQSQCLFTNNRTYILFSSMVSFYIPLVIILFSYGQVFVIATRHTRNMRIGRKMVQVKNPSSDSGHSEESTPMLGIHWDKLKPKLEPKPKSPGTGRTSSNVRMSRVKVRRETEDTATTSSRECSQSPLLRPESSGGTTSSSSSTVRRNFTARKMLRSQLNGFNKAPTMLSIVLRDHANETLTTVSARKKPGVRERSRQVLRYVREQRAARTLFIVVGVFILCWTPLFIFSPIMALCETCLSDREMIFSLITWAGHLNSMLNPFIYSRFSRDFRRAFNQILTRERERGVKHAIRSPLGVVFAQLVSVTHLWEQPPATITQ